MNWTTTTSPANRMEGDDVCEHVEKNPDLAVIIYREMDSMGPVGGFVACKECKEEQERQEQERMTNCDDCYKEILASETITWRHWDHDPSQGDEELTVCNDCVDKPKHKKRVASDDAAYRREMDYD